MIPAPDAVVRVGAHGSDLEEGGLGRARRRGDGGD